MKLYTWDDLYERAMDCGYGDAELTAKDTARWQLQGIIADKKNYDIEECECPEEEIDRFLEEENEEYWFDENGMFVETKLKEVV